VGYVMIENDVFWPKIDDLAWPASGLHNH
jgi:hypothetical protein